MKIFFTKTAKRILRSALVFIIVFSWIFGGWPQFLNFPIKIPEVKAAVTTNNPSANTGTAWTNPANAYADGTSYANITSGSPSGSNVWGNYGFSLTGATISQVRIGYDAHSAGASGQSVTRQATSDDSMSGFAINSPYYSKINDSNDSTLISSVTNGAGNYALFGYTAFTVPANSVITDVSIHYRVRSATTGTTASHGSCIKLGSTIYGRGQTAGWDAGSASVPASTSAIGDVIYNGTNNPATGTAWTPAEVNAITAFGVCSNDSNPDVNFYQADITVNYTEVDDQIKVDVSWDGGSSWSATQDTTLTGTEATTWYDVTAVTAWTPAKLADGQLQVRALAQTVNTAEEVRLDWIPVEVTYTPNSAPTLSVSQPDGTSDTVTVGSSYNITYDLADSDNVVTAAFYYDTNNDKTGGIAISGACATAAEGAGATCSWDTTGVTPASYYVYGITSDSINPQVDAVSSGQITINGPNSAPTLSVSQPDGVSDTIVVGVSYDITYTLADSDNVVTVAFYYDTNNDKTGGTAISGPCATAAEGTGTTCAWNTTGVTPGSYYVYGVTNDGVNPAVDALSPGQIAINAQSLSFSISDNTIGFGTLSASAARYATGDASGNAAEIEAHTLTVSSNAGSGYTITVQGATLAHNGNGALTVSAIGGTNTASSPGSEQFGIRSSVNSGTGTVTAPYAAAGFAYAADASTSDEVASGAGDGSSTVFSIRYLANISSSTEAGDYSTVLTYVATATF